jgi:DNA-binding NtrC family response regulator
VCATGVEVSHREVSMEIQHEDDETLARDIACALRSEVNVLISGGDRHVRLTLARMIYQAHYSRRPHPLVHLRPAEATLEPLDLIRNGVGGTLLVEEVGALSPVAQAELGRLLERSPTRVIATTAHNLFAATSFDPDLFYRLNTIHLVLSDAGHFTA